MKWKMKMSRKRKPQKKVVLGTLVMTDKDDNEQHVPIKGHPRNVKRRAELAKLQHQLEAGGTPEG